MKQVIKLLLTFFRESRKIKYTHLPVHKNHSSNASITELFMLITILSVLHALIVSLWHTEGKNDIL